MNLVSDTAYYGEKASKMVNFTLKIVPKSINFFTVH